MGIHAHLPHRRPRRRGTGILPIPTAAVILRPYPIKDLPMPTKVPETQKVTTWKVACDGGEGALGHPRVWLSIPQDTGFVECGYCDKRFEIDRAHAHDDH
jgi:uncharacterized Zn-finger protein